MIKSMTGFGRGEHTGASKRVTVEAKSVNHRYVEVAVKLPRKYMLLEDAIKSCILERVLRGRVEIFIKMEDLGSKPLEVRVDKDLALAYHKALKELANITESEAKVDVCRLAQMPEVLQVEEKEDDFAKVWSEIEPALQMAVELLLEMRSKEGEKLSVDLAEHLQVIKEEHRGIAEKSGQVVEYYREKLNNRLAELIGKDVVDEGRLAMEVAVFADRACIDEELVRLQSHLGQFEQILEEDGAVGRKLDFLLQEMNREVNTIGSKANNLEITQGVVSMKSELEKLREQVQNIE